MDFVKYSFIDGIYVLEQLSLDDGLKQLANSSNVIYQPVLSESDLSISIQGRVPEREYVDDKSNNGNGYFLMDGDVDLSPGYYPSRLKSRHVKIRLTAPYIIRYIAKDEPLIVHFDDIDIDNIELEDR